MKEEGALEGWVSVHAMDCSSSSSDGSTRVVICGAVRKAWEYLVLDTPAAPSCKLARGVHSTSHLTFPILPYEECHLPPSRV